MTYSNKQIFNFSGGEVSPGLVARQDLPLYNRILQYMKNFVAEPQGYSRYRQGFKKEHNTRNHNKASLIEFQFSDSQSYLLELTEGWLRVHKNHAPVLSSTTQNITGITQANPGVVTYTGVDYYEGQEVYIDNVVGMTEVNGRYFRAKNVNTGANTFQLSDSFSANVDTTNYTAYSSGGGINAVYEINTPYLEEDIPYIEFTQTADVMYLTSRRYETRKLTRSGHDSWSLARYTRTSDPFETAYTITGITQANPGVVTISSTADMSTGDTVYIDSVVGMTEVNNRWFKVTVLSGTTFSLQDVDTNANINTSGYTAYSSGGKAEDLDRGGYPGATAFTADGRLMLNGTDDASETMAFSKGPDSSTGDLRPDDFTTGTDPLNAMLFTLAPLRGKVDSIRWTTNTDKYTAVGTFGSVRRVFGATEEQPVEPLAVSAKPANADGVFRARPVVDGPTLFYIDRAGTTLNAIEYNYQIDGYQPDDKNLVSETLSRPGLRQIRRQMGRPTLIWALRADGVLLALTYAGKENIAGWHQHHLGGGGFAEALGVMPQDDGDDEIWVVAKYTVDGNTARYLMYESERPVYPRRDDYYALGADESEDRELFHSYQWEVRKAAVHLDMASTYDGSEYGTDASATLTVGAGADTEDTEDVVFTASAAVFTASMVGREIWGAYDAQGGGGGRAEITAFTSSTIVECTILDPFPASEVFAAGDWFITATELTGLYHLEGKTVTIVADGGVADTEVVVDGAITIDEPASVIHVGLPYTGIMRTLPLDQGGVSGTAINKIKIIPQIGVRVLDSGEFKMGTGLYNLESVIPDTEAYTDRPRNLVTGIVERSYSDSWGADKEIFIVQDNPTPLIVASLDVYTETTDE